MRVLTNMRAAKKETSTKRACVDLVAWRTTVKYTRADILTQHSNLQYSYYIILLVASASLQHDSGSARVVGREAVPVAIQRVPHGCLRAFGA